tara:strand:- start:34426 stop:35235 length:810 start_codon:yes stop_codon:yes gene_type:complete
LFTSHDQPIEYNDGTGPELYGPAGGFDASAIQLAAGLREQNLDIDGVIDSEHITHEDLRSGKFKGATVLSSQVDWKYPMAGAIYVREYEIGRCKYTGEIWTVELNGLTNKLQKRSGRLYTRPCNADVFDGRCGILPSSVTGGEVASVRVDPGTQDSVEPRRIFEAVLSDLPSTSDDFYKYGEIRWNTSTANGAVGHVSIIKAYTDTNRLLQIYEPTPFAIADDDRFTIIVGCDKLFSTCVTKFTNGINYRGHHLMPSSDKVLKTPGTQG